MAQDYTTYLAANVLNEGNVITYRALSRALKVHSNIAKRMLYDFYQGQNGKNPGSVHATYLLCGTVSLRNAVDDNGSIQDDCENVHMRSSPFMSSSMPQDEEESTVPAITSITLVREEHLEAAKRRYDVISSIHLYSLGCSSVQNLQILSDCTREISIASATEDPMEAGNMYGVICNSRVKRRTGSRPTVIAPPGKTMIADTVPVSRMAPPTAQSRKEDGKATSIADQLKTKPDVKSEHPTDTTKMANGKNPGLKREYSDIFKPFSKPKPRLVREGTGSSIEATPAAKVSQSEAASNREDEPMKDASEEEQDDDLLVISGKDSRQKGDSRTEREEKIRKMMDDEDEPMANAPSEPPEEPVPSVPASQEELPSEPLVEVSGGRRRGRRKIMKKKMLKDEEGYLVTKEEPAWESFSEDEAPPPSSKPKPASSSVPSKGKKTAGKPGQGSIKSFFGKK